MHAHDLHIARHRVARALACRDFLRAATASSADVITMGKSWATSRTPALIMTNVLMTPRKPRRPTQRCASAPTDDTTFTALIAAQTIC